MSKYVLPDRDSNEVMIFELVAMKSCLVKFWALADSAQAQPAGLEPGLNQEIKSLHTKEQNLLDLAHQLLPRD